MQIRDAEIFSFGKFHGKKIQLKSGINVIYGENETGKSTLHDFLVAMLFGMDKGRGRDTLHNSYLRYEPWHAPAYYSGAIRFTVEGRPFYLERNFYHREKRDFLRNEADGEELSVAYGDLGVLLGGIHKETFGNTYDISQSGAVTGKELANSLAEYLADAAESGDSGFHVKRAIEALREKQKKICTEQKQMQREKEQQETVLKIEQELLERDCEKLREDIAVAESRMEQNQTQQHQIVEKSKERGANEDKYAKGFVRRGIRLAGTVVLLVFGMMFVLLMGQTVSKGKNLFEFLAGGLGLVAFGLALYGVGILWTVRKQKIFLPIEEENMPKERNQAERMLDVLKETLNEKETRLYNIAEQLELSEMPTAHEIELQQESSAAQLAADEIEHLAKEFCEEAGDALNGEVSRYVSAITGGRYDSVRIDENGKLWVSIGGREVSPEALSRGTLEQFYLALRFAVGKVVTKEETMPIFLDDAFVWYDDMRLEQTLKMLSELGGQILLFTCQNREAEMLSKMRIAYHRINLEQS